MRNFLAYLLCAVLCVSCAYNKATIYGVGEVVSSNFMGDGSTANTILGNSYVAKNSTATRYIVNALGTIVGLYYAGMANVNGHIENAYVSGNSVIAAGNKNQLGYLGGVVPKGGLAPGQVVPPLPQSSPLGVPPFR